MIGVVLADNSKAYYYEDVSNKGTVNDILAGIPILLLATKNNYSTFYRRVEDQVLTFQFVKGQLTDEETGSTWDPSRGLAIDGPLAGRSMQAIPCLSSFDWAWVDFYPESDFYQP